MRPVMDYLPVLFLINTITLKKRTEYGGDISKLSQVSPKHVASILNVSSHMLNSVCGKLE